MNRTALITPVLILSLLVCPLHCVGALTAAEEGSAVAEGGCACCAQPADTGEKPESPPLSEDAGACGNCLCHGAIVAVDSSGPMVELDAELGFDFDHLTETTYSSALRLQRHWLATLPEPILPYRYSVCIRYQSLLL